MKHSILFLFALLALKSFSSSYTDSLKTLLDSKKECPDKIYTLLTLAKQYERIDYDSARLFYVEGRDLCLKCRDINVESGLYDSLRVGAMQDIAITYYFAAEYEKALTLLKEVQLACDSVNYQLRSIECINNMGVINSMLGNYDQSIEMFREAGTRFLLIGDSSGYAASVNNVGYIYQAQGKYPEAVEKYQVVLDLNEQLNNKEGIAIAYNNLGNANYSLRNIDKAYEYFKKAEAIRREMNDDNGIATILNNLGSMKLTEGKNEESLPYYEESLAIRRKIKDYNGVVSSLINLGLAYTNLERFDKAVEALSESLIMVREMQDKKQLYATLNNLGKAYFKMKRFSEAKKLLDESLKLADEMNTWTEKRDVYQLISEFYEDQGKSVVALEWYKKYKIACDSVFDTDKAKQLQELETKYETEKKQLEIVALTREKSLQEMEIVQQKEEMQKQRVIIFASIAVLLIIIVFSILLYKQFSEKKKANLILEEQNEEIRQKNEEILSQRDEILTQRDEIEAQRDMVTSQRDHIQYIHEELTDSINYAKHIQNAILPSEKSAKSVLGENFIIFRPKEAVSGDFYWAVEVNDWLVVTVADCTGHGVPGAFMSMLGVTYLNEIVRKKEVVNAAIILNELRAYIIEALNQKGEDSSLSERAPVKDGMDMSVIVISSDRKNAFWAGANNPLWILRHDIKENVDDKADLIEVLKGDNMPVAFYENMRDFTNHKVALSKGDKLYLFSDGLPDQFGGEKGKKFKYKSFKRLIVETSVYSMDEQGIQIQKALNEWISPPERKGNPYEQIDDITVLGLKV